MNTLRRFLRGKREGAAAYLVIVTLVAGGLAWATAEALRLEQEQAQARAEGEWADKVRLALWRLDSRVFPLLAREASRPYHHYSAVFAPGLVLQTSGQPWPPGQVLELSPLLNEDLPPWMVLHFQSAAEAGQSRPRVSSPQVLSDSLRQRLREAEARLGFANATAARRQALDSLRAGLDQEILVRLIAQQEARLAGLGGAGEQVTALLPPGQTRDSILNNSAVPGGQGQAAGPYQTASDPEFSRRLERQQQQYKQQGEQKLIQEEDAAENTLRNGEAWLAAGKLNRWALVSVTNGAMTPLWLPAADGGRQLVVARAVTVADRSFCQGILLDWPGLQAVLLDEVRDLFPDSRLVPVTEEEPANPARSMTALPVAFDPGPPPAVEGVGWSPLRSGLALAWAAALLALAAVGLGGWSLLDLSERRIHFVSAVTHELRTPLTTLRLYLDMLTAGLVTDGKQRDEYLATLQAEADRLHRLVGNVLDYSRLENHRVRPDLRPVRLDTVFDRLQADWAARCREAGKELVVDNAADGALVLTDAELLQQIIGNLIENACKYSRHAADPRVWLRAAGRGDGVVAVEVEDCGPGVPAAERRAIFRPFHRAKGVETTAAGVGLGLALAERWARLLGGRLGLAAPSPGGGARFRLELPAARLEGDGARDRTP
jgi:signal transduction histidine kinase